MTDEEFTRYRRCLEDEVGRWSVRSSSADGQEMVSSRLNPDVAQHSPFGSEGKVRHVAQTYVELDWTYLMYVFDGQSTCFLSVGEMNIKQ